MTTRRDLFRFAAAVALARFAPAGRSRRVVPLGLLLTPGSAAERGAALGLAEAQRAGDQLAVDFRAAPTSTFALIGLTPPKTTSRALFLVTGPAAEPEGPMHPRVYSVAAGPRFRKEALASQGSQGLRVVDWHPDLDLFGAGALNLRYRRRFGTPMDESAWRGWMAVKIAAELALRGPGTDPAGYVEALRFDGHKGLPLRFDRRDRHLRQPVYLVDAKGKLIRELRPEEED